MRKLDETIANLKLALATIESKEQALLQAERQASAQYKRIVNYTLYEGGDLERALNMMDEIGQRTQYARSSLEHLKLIKQRAQDDLRAMQLTKTIEDAKAELSQLQAKQAQGEALEDAIAELEGRISEASALAGRLISPS
ncbi:MAG TPA: hypothetical protein VK457_07215 [Chloroflexota bacterium]|jgi:hypothetical protein|nr:hypothetical protein [Chloroflexota bacterium]